MTRMVRQFYAAALVAGFGLPAVIARAADKQTYWPDNTTSQVQLISATEELPQRADSSSARSSDPRDGDSPAADSSSSRTATYPPKKPVKKPAPKAAPKSFNGAPDLSDVQPGTTRKQAAAVTRHDSQGAPPSQLRAASAPRRESQLTARYADEGDSPETMKKPSAAPLPPTAAGPANDLTSSESCNDCGACCECPVWCGGLEYLYLRPHFGNDLALHELTATTNGATVTNDDRTINFGYNYDSDVRFFVGRRMGAGELRFAYTHIQADANESGTADGGFANGSGVAFSGLGTTQISGAGDSINATSHLLLNLYDIDRLQHLDLPGCGDCGSAWDISWSYGVRIADIHRTIDEQDPVETVNLGSTFVGAGPRIGLEARRHLWCSNLSGFLSANAGLLVGRYRSTFRETTPGILQTTVNTQENDLTRTVPNFEMSLGVSWQPTCHTTITTGWMVETFTDGIGSTASTGGCTTCNMINPLAGSGNILSFDGLFIRMEHCF